MRVGPVLKVTIKVLLSLAAVAGFVALIAIGPYRGESRPPADPTPAAAAPSAGAPPPVSGPHDFFFNGLPVRIEEVRLDACNPLRWDPFTAGLCPGDCTLLSDRRDAGTATFSWLEAESADTGLPRTLHAVSLTCDGDGAAGSALHVSTPLDSDHQTIVPQAGAAGRRQDPVPLLPGATEIARYQGGSWAFFVDRPHFPATALDTFQLELIASGWQPVGKKAPELPPGAPPTRVLTRGPETCIATLSDDDDPMLISAYSRHGWAPELRP